MPDDTPPKQIVSSKSLGVSDVVWQALIGGFVTIVLAYMSHRTSNSVDENKRAVEEARDELANVKEAIHKTTEAVASVEKSQDLTTAAVKNVPEATAAATAEKVIPVKPITKGEME